MLPRFIRRIQSLLSRQREALDQNGKSSFQLLQSFAIRKGIPLVYYVFDLLALDGTDLRAQPLFERRNGLAKLLRNAPDNIRFSEELQSRREELLQIARQFHSKD